VVALGLRMVRALRLLFGQVRCLLRLDVGIGPSSSAASSAVVPSLVSLLKAVVELLCRSVVALSQGLLVLPVEFPFRVSFLDGFRGQALAPSALRCFLFLLGDLFL
jgi:hypothetical protein